VNICHLEGGGGGNETRKREMTLLQYHIATLENHGLFAKKAQCKKVAKLTEGSDSDRRVRIGMAHSILFFA
jgi:hypothetical protein